MTTNLHKAAAAMGRKGGKAGTGASKARTTEQARKAALARWAKHNQQEKAKFMGRTREGDAVFYMETNQRNKENTK